MSDPINWYQSQRSTADLLFASVDPTLPAPWRSVMDDYGVLAFYWNPETNVSQYEHPNPPPPPPPPPHPSPDHCQFPFEYKPTLPSSDLTYRPPDYPASYMPELPVGASYTSPIFPPHPTPPSVMYSDSIDDPQIYPPSSYEQDLWVFDSENPHFSHHYPPPPPIHGPHFTQPYSIPQKSTMPIPAPDFMGTMTSTPAVWEFTTSALTPVLHRDGLGKQISSVSDPMSSLGVCQDMMHTTITMVPPLLSSSLPLTSISHLESVVIAPQSECSPEPSPEFGSSPTLPLSMSSLQPPPRLPWQIRSSPQSKLQDHRVSPLRSTSPLLTAMVTPSRTRASAMEGFRQTNHFRHTLQQTTRFLQTVPHMEMKRRPKTRVLAFRLSKHSSHFSSSSVGASLHSYFLTAALVKNVLINVVTKSRLTSCSQPCTDSRVVPPLDHPTDAMEELSLKANVIQIAHPLHPPKAPDKAIHCQVPILYSPLKQARLHLEFIPPYMTFAMIVFNSYGSRRNILAHKVFDKMQQRGIAQKYVPDLLLVPHHLREITKSVPDFLLVEFGEPIDYSAYLDTISQPTKIPRKLKSSRQYREYMGNLLAYLIYFFQRTEPLQDLNRIFLKVATALEEHWADGLSRQLSIHFFGTQLRDGSIFAYFASKQLPGVLTSRCLRNNRPHQIVLRLPNRRLAILCVQMGVIELVVKSLIQSYLGVMSRIQACKTVEEYGHSEFKAVSCWKTIWHDLANTGGIHNFELKYIDGMSHTHRLLQEFKLLWSSYLDEHTEISYASLVLLSRWFWTSIIIAEDTCCLAPRFIQRSHGTTAYMYGVGLTNIVEKLHVALASLGLKTGGTVQRVVATILGFPIALSTGTFAGVSLCSMDIFLRLIGKVPKWEFTGRGYMICSTIWNNILTIMANSMFSTFMSGLIKVISTFTLSSHMIDTTSVCLVVYNCNPCAITFLFGSIIIVSPTIYFLGYLFPNKIGSRMLLGRKMQQAPPWSDGFFVLIWEVFMTATCWAFPLAEEEMTIIPSRAFSPSLVSRMQWRPGSSFQNQNEGMFHGRTEIAPDQREFFLQRLQQVQQQGHSTILGMPPLVGGNHKQFSAHQNPLLQQFNSQNSSVPSQAGLGLGVQPPVLGTVAPTTLQQQLNPIHQQSNQEALMSSGLTEDHKRANYRMLCADSLLYLRDYQAIQSSMECLNWWAIPSKIFGVLPNNNCPSVSNLGVFLFTMVSLSLPIVHSWVCNLLEHLFISTNSDLIVFSATSWIDHPLGVTEPQNLNAHIRSCLFMTTITATWVPAAQNACLTRKHLIRLLDTKRVRQSLLLHDARQSGALPLLSSIVSENQLDRHCDSFGESQLLNTSFPV